jgi:hypothetical protein
VSSRFGDSTGATYRQQGMGSKCLSVLSFSRAKPPRRSCKQDTLDNRSGLISARVQSAHHAGLPADLGFVEVTTREPIHRERLANLYPASCNLSLWLLTGLREI